MQYNEVNNSVTTQQLRGHVDHSSPMRIKLLYSYKYYIQRNYIQGGPSKVKPTTILLETFECIGKIQ